MGMVIVRVTLGYIIGVLLLCVSGKRCGAWMVIEIGSWEVHDRCVELGCDTMGLPTSSGRCRDDANLPALIGIFF